MNDPLYDLALRTVCPRCEALVGKPCVTMSGNRTGVHTARLDPLREAYGRGYEAAQA